MKKKLKLNFFLFYLIFLSLFIIFFILKLLPYSEKYINQEDFFNLFSYGRIEKIVIQHKEIIEIQFKKNNLKYNKLNDWLFNRYNNPYLKYKFEISNFEEFQNKLYFYKKKYSINTNIYYNNIKNFTIKKFILDYGLFLILLIIFWIFIFRKIEDSNELNGNQFLNIVKSQAKLFDENYNIKITFKNVAGLEGPKEEVQEIVEFLKNPSKYTNLGGRIIRGVLLVGPPGTGKTLLAKAVAGEANVPFFSLSGSDFVEMFVGVGASRVRDLFERAKNQSPCIIFIDEIDAIGRARNKSNFINSNDERENTLNQLLTEMDGFDTNTNVIVLAATNRADILDKALLRPGRFDRNICIELPNLSERKDIFMVHIKKLKLSKKVKVNFLAKQTPGFSGADIENICNEAALLAARKNKKQVENQDFIDAVDRFVGGLERKSKIIKPDEKKRIAYHESGHATTSWLLKYAAPLVKVTIVPRGKTLGSAWYLPEERNITTIEQMKDEICTLLSGRASEEIIFNSISTGALNDLERSTKKAMFMVTCLGFSPALGNISYYDSSGKRNYNFIKPYSEERAKLIDYEISKIIDEQYKKAKKILLKNKEKISILANSLLEKEVIFKKDMKKIFGKRPFKDE